MFRNIGEQVTHPELMIKVSIVGFREHKSFIDLQCITVAQSFVQCFRFLFVFFCFIRSIWLNSWLLLLCNKITGEEEEKYNQRNSFHSYVIVLQNKGKMRPLLPLSCINYSQSSPFPSILHKWSDYKGKQGEKWIKHRHSQQ